MKMVNMQRRAAVSISVTTLTQCGVASLLQFTCLFFAVNRTAVSNTTQSILVLLYKLLQSDEEEERKQASCENKLAVLQGIVTSPDFNKTYRGRAMT